MKKTFVRSTETGDSPDFQLIDVNIKLNEIIAGIAASRKQTEEYNHSLIEQIGCQTSEIAWRNTALDVIRDQVCLVNGRGVVVFQNQASKDCWGDLVGQSAAPLVGSIIRIDHNFHQYTKGPITKSGIITKDDSIFNVTIHSAQPGHLVTIHTQENGNDTRMNSANNQHIRDTSHDKTTILHIDDDKNILDIVRLMLRSHDYRLVSEVDGTKAKELALQHQPDVILLDIMMPEINGFELIEQFKADHRLQNIPILVLSVSDSEDKCRELGADGYLSKPIEESQLIKKIQAVITK